jgi:hypothetical protein
MKQGQRNIKKNIETCPKWNQGLTEVVFSRKLSQSQGFGVPRIQASSTCIKWNIPAIKRIFQSLAVLL